MPTENELLIQALRSPYAFKTEGDPSVPKESMMYDNPGLTGGVGGADVSGGIQPNMAEPNQIAAYRMARAVAPEQGRQDSGAANVLAGLMVPGLSAAQLAAQGDYGGAAGSAALSAVPFGLARLGRYAAPALQGWYGSSLLAPEALAEEKSKNPFVFDEAGYEKRRKAVLKDGNPRALREFEAREGQARAETQQKAAAWEEANQGKIQAANALEGYKKSVAPSAQVLKKESQDKIQNATSIEDATKFYNDAMNDYTSGHKTSYEKFQGPIETGVIAASALGGGIGNAIARGRANSLRNAETSASNAYDARWGSPTRGIKAPTTPEAISGADSELLKARNALSGAANLPQHAGLGATALAGVPPWFIGAFGPNMYDAMLNPHQDIRERALGNLIPGYSKDEAGNRDWTGPLLTHIRPFLEGAGSHATGAALAGGKDYAKLQNVAGSTVKSINDRADIFKQEQEKMAKALKTPKTRVAPQAPVAQPRTPPSTPQIPPEAWGRILGTQDYSGAVLKNLQKKLGTDLPISGIKFRKE